MVNLLELLILDDFYIILIYTLHFNEKWEKYNIKKLEMLE